MRTAANWVEEVRSANLNGDRLKDFTEKYPTFESFLQAVQEDSKTDSKDVDFNYTSEEKLIMAASMILN